MNIMRYSPDEILGIAIEIEKNASSYYRDAAQQTEESDLHATFVRLSEMEDAHRRIFTEMREGLSEAERTVQTHDPGNEMVYYLRSMQGLHGWEGKAGPNKRLSGAESSEEVLSTALEAEQETVFFYSFLKDYVPSPRGTSAVDRIIKEEMGHVATINRYLNQVRST